MSPSERGEAHAGWDWFMPAGDGEAFTDPGRREMARAFARCFRPPDGDAVLAYLRAMTTDRALSPGAPDAALRHLEGQRQLVAHIDALVREGRRQP